MLPNVGDDLRVKLEWAHGETERSQFSSVCHDSAVSASRDREGTSSILTLFDSFAHLGHLSRGSGQKGKNLEREFPSSGILCRGPRNAKTGRDFAALPIIFC